MRHTYLRQCCAQRVQFQLIRGGQAAGGRPGTMALRQINAGARDPPCTPHQDEERGRARWASCMKIAAQQVVTREIGEHACLGPSLGSAKSHRSRHASLAIITLQIAAAPVADMGQAKSAAVISRSPSRGRTMYCRSASGNSSPRPLKTRTGSSATQACKTNCRTFGACCTQSVRLTRSVKRGGRADLPPPQPAIGGRFRSHACWHHEDARAAPHAEAGHRVAAGPR